MGQAHFPCDPLHALAGTVQREELAQGISPGYIYVTSSLERGGGSEWWDYPRNRSIIPLSAGCLLFTHLLVEIISLLLLYSHTPSTHRARIALHLVPSFLY